MAIFLPPEFFLNHLLQSKIKNFCKFLDFIRFRFLFFIEKILTKSSSSFEIDKSSKALPSIKKFSIKN